MPTAKHQSQSAIMQAMRLRLSPEDREKYDSDMLLFARAVMREKEDGTVVYVPPEQWSYLIRLVK